jgi:hypothetical protein
VSSIVQFLQFNNLKVHLTLFVFWIIFIILLVLII